MLIHEIELTLGSAIHRGNVRVCKKHGENVQGERPKGGSVRGRNVLHPLAYST